MTLFASRKTVKAVSAAPSDQQNDVSLNIPADTDAASRHVFMGDKPVLRNWKIMASSEEVEPSEPPEKDNDEESLFSSLVGTSVRSVKQVVPAWLQIAQAVAVFLTVAWVSYATIYILALPGSVKAITASPLTLGGILASVLAPVALLWLCLATWQRRSDAHIYAQALRQELQQLLFPTAEQSRVVNREIQTLVQQAVEMSSSSRAAIKAIQRARQGLRSEIRDFSGVSQKTEFHIDRLAETLSARAEEILSLTEKIEAQSDIIGLKAKDSVSAWVKASDEIAGKSDEIEHVLERGVDQLLKASEDASARVQTIEDRLSVAASALSARVGEISSRFAGTSSQFEKHADELSRVSDTVAAEAARLEGTMQARVSELELLTRKNVSALEDAQKSTLEQQEKLEQGAQRIADSAGRVMSAVTSGLEKVEESTTAILVRVEGIDEKLAGRAQALESVTVDLLKGTENIGQVSEVATHKLSEALSMALAGADSVVSAVRRSRDMYDRALSDTTSQIDRLAEVADQKVLQLVAAAGSQVEKFEKLNENIDGRQEKLDQSLMRLDRQKDEIFSVVEGAVTRLNEAADFISQRSTEPLLLVDQAAERLSGEALALNAKLSARVVEIDQGTTKARDMAEQICVSIKGSLQDVAEVAGEIKIHTRSVTEDVATQRQSLRALVVEMEEKTGVMQSLLRAQTQDLNATLDMTESQIILLGQSFFDRGDRIIRQVGDISGELSQLQNNVSFTLADLETKSARAKDAVQEATESLRDVAGIALPEYDRVISKSTELESRYQQLRSAYASTTETVMVSLEEMGNRLEGKLTDIDASATGSVRTLNALVEDLTSSIDSVRHVAEGAQIGIEQVQNGVKGRVEDLQLITDQVRLRVDSMQKNLGEYIQELGGVVGRAVAQMSEATEQFGHSTQVLDTKADSTSEKLLGASRQYIEEGHRLSLLAEQAVHKAARIISSVQEESSRMIDSSKGSLLELQKSGDSLSIRAREVEEFMKASVKNAQLYGEELRGQASIIAESSAEAVDRIAEATSRLVVEARQVKGLSESVSENIDTSCQHLADESGRLASIAKRAVDSADEAALSFTRHSNVLFRAVQEVSAQTEKIKDTQWKAQREAFLSSSRFVIESLYSLALDVSRHLENDVDDRVLRAYQKGDVAAFTRHLVEIAPRIPAEKTQRKFIEDGEFRNYVQRFIRQFEEVLEQSQNNDYGDLLSSVFSTSDIGKLYKILCEVAGRNAKTH